MAGKPGKIGVLPPGVTMPNQGQLQTFAKTTKAKIVQADAAAKPPDNNDDAAGYPTPANRQTWDVNPNQVQPVPTRRPLWMRPTYRPSEGPKHLATVQPTQYSAKDVLEQSPEFVAALHDTIKNRVSKLAPEDHGPFEAGFLQNPEGAAASIAARFLDTMRPFEKTTPPPMDEALRAKVRANELWTWLNWTKG
jgi:hypothetical protein